MTAKSAADALMTFDATLAEQVQKLFAGCSGSHFKVSSEEKARLIREVAGTWTLSLAASAAGVTERQVLVALTRHHLHHGMNPASSALVEAALNSAI